MFTIPVGVSLGIVTSLKGILPDGYRAEVVGSGRSLLVDCPFGMMLSMCFVHPLTPFSRRRAIIECAEAAMSEVEDFVTGHEGGSQWLDTDYLAIGDIASRARIRSGELQMVYSSGATIIRVLDPVNLSAAAAAAATPGPEYIRPTRPTEQEVLDRYRRYLATASASPDANSGTDEPELDEWVEEYDQETAELVLDGRVVGLLLLDASVRTRAEGPWFRRRKTALVRLEWSVSFQAEGRSPDDGFFQNAEETADLDRDVFVHRGTAYSLRWLDGEDAVLARFRHSRAVYGSE